MHCGYGREIWKARKENKHFPKEKRGLPEWIHTVRNNFMSYINFMSSFYLKRQLSTCSFINLNVNRAKTKKDAKSDHMSILSKILRFNWIIGPIREIGKFLINVHEKNYESYFKTHDTLYLILILLSNCCMFGDSPKYLTFSWLF